MTNSERFLRFMEARESIRLRKDAGEEWPWSNDDILNTYKFTNVKREHDRTTAWMRKNWTEPNDNRSAGEIVFNCALFRYFGTTVFAETLGWIREWDPERVIALARNKMESGTRIFTGAYIIPTLGYQGPKYIPVVTKILDPLWRDRARIGEIARETQSWRATGEALGKFTGFGGSGFMVKETLQDALHTSALRDAFDRNSWCPIGPGARRGLNRLMGQPINRPIQFDLGLSEMKRLLDLARDTLPDWMPELELHDIQFQLCEFDKYERVRLGEGRPKARYRRNKCLG